MHPHIHDALARAQADEIARRTARERRRAELSVRLGPRLHRVEDHAYTLPRVTELRRPAEPDTFDPSVW